jgi:hypothetical protein
MSLLLPKLQKTWQATTLVSVTGGDVADQQDIEFKKKTQLITYGLTCSGSGNATSANLSGTDTWASSADIVNGSWFVWKMPGSGAQLIMSHLISGQSNWTWAFSPGGLYTGGSVGTPPTAADAVPLYMNNSFHGRGDGSNSLPLICHVLVSEDLTCLRMIHFYNNFNYGNLHLEQANTTNGLWTPPTWGCVDKNGFGKDASQDVGDVLRWLTEFGGGGTGMMQARGPIGGNTTVMQMTATIESCLGQGGSSLYAQILPGILTSKDANTNDWRPFPLQIGMFRNVGYSDAGWQGRPYDLWVVPKDGSVWLTGNTTPLDGSKQFVVVGNFLHPWNGGAFRMT